jgi:hypothetical protein
MEFKIISCDIGQIPTWIGALATVAAVLVALFGDVLKGLIYKPVLNVTIKDGYPDHVVVQKGNGLYSFFSFYSLYSRLWIVNDGRSSAQNVEVYVKTIKKKNAHGIFVDDEFWQPMNLIWSNIGGIYLENLPVGMGKHCDFTELYNGNEWFVFCSIDPPNNGSHQKGIGVYRAEVLVAATNHKKPKSVIVEIDFIEKFNYTDTNKLYDKTPHENKVPVKMRIVDKRIY